MKKYLLLLLALVCLLSLAGCGCEHQWLDATGGHGQVCDLCGETQNTDEPCNYQAGDLLDCENPKKCLRCGKPEVEAKDHAWKDATCYDPKICADCGAMQGQPAGHRYADIPLDCENPAACTVCGQLRQETKPHTWVDATTTAPKTCSVCGETEGEPLDGSTLFDAEACQVLFGTWQGEFVMTGEMMGDASLPDVPVTLGITFCDDGTYSETIRLVDKAAFQKDLTDYYIQALYAEFEAAYGMTKEQADQTMMEAYGKDVAGYAALLAQVVDIDALLAVSAGRGVYYVADGQLYFGGTWETVEAEPLLVEDDKLTITVAGSSETVTMTRVG